MTLCLCIIMILKSLLKKLLCLEHSSRQTPNWKSMVEVLRMKSHILTEEVLLIPVVAIYSKRQPHGSLPDSGLGFQSERNSKQGIDGPPKLIWQRLVLSQTLLQDSLTPGKAPCPPHPRRETPWRQGCFFFMFMFMFSMSSTVISQREDIKYFLAYLLDVQFLYACVSIVRWISSFNSVTSYLCGLYLSEPLCLE